MALPRLVRKASGIDGRISFPDIGALVGYFTNWKLWVADDRAETYHFQANCGFVNRRLLALPEDDRGPTKVVIDMGGGKHYRLVQADGGKQELTGDTFFMDGVTLEQHEGRN